jgi:hypothetical protein
MPACDADLTKEKHYVHTLGFEVVQPPVLEMNGENSVETITALIASAEVIVPRSSVAFSHPLKGLLNPALVMDGANQNAAASLCTNNNNDSIHGSFIFLTPILDSSTQELLRICEQDIVTQYISTEKK